MPHSSRLTVFRSTAILKKTSSIKPMTRKKLNRTIINVRVAADTPTKMKEIAKTLDYIYAGEGQTGALLDAIANGEIVVIKRA